MGIMLPSKQPDEFHFFQVYRGDESVLRPAHTVSLFPIRSYHKRIPVSGVIRSGAGSERRKRDISHMAVVAAAEFLHDVIVYENNIPEISIRGNADMVRRIRTWFCSYRHKSHG